MGIRALALPLALAALAPAPAHAAAARTLSVAVAANVLPAAREIARAFEAESGAVVRLTPGSSGELAAQIENGAPFDLFLSADMGYPRRLRKDGFAAAPAPYARGTLIVWSLSGLDLSKGLAALADAKAVRIALADPGTAPYGRAAEQALEASGLRGALAPKLVYGESVSQVDGFVASRAVEAGFTSRSAVERRRWKGKGAWFAVPPRLYAPIDQGLVVLAHGERTAPALAERLRAFVLGPRGRAILRRAGYGTPP
ncbi:MAG: molybdate ABC transporter substrate-binding protein [Elusimicrobia bacterium]|nr:molybdate ABC transporter substrate-binding protein [Elusimicrobiota bacterium]